MTVLILCGCCLIPCVRGLVSRTLERSMTQQMVRYGPIPDSDLWRTEGMSTEEVDESGSFICGEFMFDETSVEMKGN